MNVGILNVPLAIARIKKLSSDNSLHEIEMEGESLFLDDAFLLPLECSS